jgi:ADP-heptose:LPS heptosyltransferase
MAMNESKRLSIGSAPEQLASGLISEFRATGRYQRERLRRLIELAVSDDRETAELASGAFFKEIVERLSDSFDPDAVSIYNCAFAHFIENARRTRLGGAIDSELRRFKLDSEDDLIARAEALRRVQPLEWLRRRRNEIRRVIVLSRVTLGADVAITSVIIERMRLEFPNAEITLAGGRKAAELFGGDAQLSFKEINYSRSANAVEKLLSWLDVLASVREATDDLNRGQYIVVDPDSRLTQLGLLPVTQSGEDLGDYLFFPSREYGSDTRLSLGELTSLWLDEVFGASVRIYPSVNLARADLDKANELIKRMRISSRPVIAINFGVGENSMKRVGDDFERSLVCRLLEAGAMVILDKGAGGEESTRASSIINHAQAMNSQGREIKIVEVDESNIEALIKSEKLEADLLAWSGPIGLLAAMIGQSDLYIGYDSAGQHIAAAMDVPCIDVFAGYSSPRMLDRWRPTGKAEARVIAVDSTRIIDETAILSEAVRQAKELVISSQ